MTIELAYGRNDLTVDLPEARTTVIEPSHSPGLSDERGAIREALAHPIGTAPLRDWINPTDHVCIAFTDITRATPNDRIIPWLIDELRDLPQDHITLLNQNGTHRPNTRGELERMLTPEMVAKYRVLNHHSLHMMQQQKG